MATATSAITNGGTTATGNIGASGATFNYGYFTNLTGTLQTATQNNITSASALETVGTITAGTWSSTFGNVSGANLTVLTAGNLIGTISSTVLGNSTVYIGTTAIALNRSSAIQSLTGVNIDGGAGYVAASSLTGSALPTAVVSSNLQSVGTLGSLAVAGNIRTNGTLIANGAVASTSTATGALQVTGGVGITGNINAAGSITAPTFVGNVTGNLTQAAQTAITSVGTLTGLTVSGAILASAHNTINIGAVGTTFATVFATTFSGVSTTARYADLAENYLSDSEYEAGTVVVFGGDKEITTTKLFADTAVAGVISTNPAYLMNDSLDGQPVALRGRVPVKVQGFTRKGDLLVTGDILGVAVSVGRDSKYGQAVFAKALENKTTAEIGVIEAVII
jgi:cytoskeletal protein CcmA (bactofilin family)